MPDDAQFKIGKISGEISGIKNDVANLRSTQKDIFALIKDNHKEVMTAVQIRECQQVDRLDGIETAVDENTCVLTEIAPMLVDLKEIKKEKRRVLIEFVAGVALAVIVWLLSKFF